MNTYIEALQAEKAGNWSHAHQLVQDLETPEAAWIHAYLHRKEGDRLNARYWYNKASQSFYEGSTDQEWENIYRRIYSN